MGMVGVNNKTSISQSKIDNWVEKRIIEFIPFKDDVEF